MRTLILTQIPDPNVPASITADQLTLIWVNHNIIDWNAMGIVSLYISAPRVPDLDGAVL